MSNHKVLTEADGQAADRVEASNLTKLRYTSGYFDETAQLEEEKYARVLTVYKEALLIIER